MDPIGRRIQWFEVLSRIVYPRFPRSVCRRIVSRAVCLLALVLAAPALGWAQEPAARVRVFLDCDRCFADFIREEVDFVDYVRDRQEADVHVLVTRAGTAGAGREFTVAFIGLKHFQGVDQTLKSVSETAETEDHIRRALATTVKIGLLGYLARNGTPALDVSVKEGSRGGAGHAGADPWNNWVFSLRGSASVEAEESSREVSLRSSIGANRITPDWKITIGGLIHHRSEHFDLDEEDPVHSSRRERSLDALGVKAFGEHWSAGMRGRMASSTFENISFLVSAAPAIEFNYFPYSAYTRRQLRAQYSIGGRRVRYFETTLFDRMQETLAEQAVSITFEQRERWGSFEARMEGSNFLPGFRRHRLEVDWESSVRIRRGLSLTADASATRLRNQLSLPKRGATAEEVLLRLRQLRSGFRFDFSLGVTYTFGSIYSSIVNPRFGT